MKEKGTKLFYNLYTEIIETIIVKHSQRGADPDKTLLKHPGIQEKDRFNKATW